MVAEAEANPPPASDFSILVKQGELWRLVGIKILLTTDANVVDRQMRLFLHNGVQDSIAFLASEVQTASTATLYQAAAGVSGFSAIPPSVSQILAMGNDVFIDFGWELKSLVQGFQVGDQLSQIVVVTERWAVV